MSVAAATRDWSERDEIQTQNILAQLAGRIEGDNRELSRNSINIKRPRSDYYTAYHATPL